MDNSNENHHPKFDGIKFNFSGVMAMQVIRSSYTNDRALTESERQEIIDNEKDKKDL